MNSWKVGMIAADAGWLAQWQEDPDKPYKNTTRHVRFVAYSPRSENISFEVSYRTMDDLITDVEGHASEFDAEEHVMKLMDEKKRGVAYFQKWNVNFTLFDLVEDVLSIKKMLDDLATRLVHARDEERKYWSQFDPKTVQKEDYEYV